MIDTVLNMYQQGGYGGMQSPAPQQAQWVSVEQHNNILKNFVRPSIYNITRGYLFHVASLAAGTRTSRDAAPTDGGARASDRSVT